MLYPFDLTVCEINSSTLFFWGFCAPISTHVHTHMHTCAHTCITPTGTTMSGYNLRFLRPLGGSKGLSHSLSAEQCFVCKATAGTSEVRGKGEGRRERETPRPPSCYTIRLADLRSTHGHSLCASCVCPVCVCVCVSFFCLYVNAHLCCVCPTVFCVLMWVSLPTASADTVICTCLWLMSSKCGCEVNVFLAQTTFEDTFKNSLCNWG